MRGINALAAVLAGHIAGSYEPKRASVCNSLTIGDAEIIDDLADVGAMPRYAMARRGYGAVQQRGGYGAQRAYPARRLIPQIPGAPAVGIRLQPLGFPVTSFILNSGQALSTTTRPQRPFKAKRLVCDIARTGATSTGLITVTTMNIGTNNQLVSSGSVGAGAFAATAFDVNLELAACTTALDITVGYANTVVVTTTDRVDIGTTMFGEAVG